MIGPHRNSSARNSVLISRLPIELTTSIDTSNSNEQLLGQLAQIIQASTRAEGVVYTRAHDHADSEQLTLQCLAGEVRSDVASCVSLCRNQAISVSTTGVASIVRHSEPPHLWLVSIPLRGRASECLHVFYDRADRPVHLLPTLHLIVSSVAIWDADQRTKSNETELRQLAALADLIARLESCDTPEQACGVLADQLQPFLGAQQVVVGLCLRSELSCRVMAVSGMAAVDLDCERMRLAQAVLDESIARGDLSTWPPIADDDRQGLCAHRQFLEFANCEGLLSAVLRDDQGRAHGAWLMLGNADCVRCAETLSFAWAAQQPLAASLKLIDRARRNRMQRMISGMHRVFCESQKTAWLACAAALIAVLLAPVPYRVSCDCEVEPVTRRFLAAPFDSELEKTFVEPGDIVSQDELLARLDGKEFHWELAATEAELQRASKELAGYQVSHESSKAQLAQHEVERLTMRRELLSRRVANLEIRSPIDGIVIAGDLERSVGMPLTMGQALFEVAPLGEMVVEVAIPEDDVRLVKTGMPIRIWLDAFPLRHWEATIGRIHPRSEAKDHCNVFVAEVNLDNPEGNFRPGMRGTTRITTIRRPLAWNLFHQAVASALRWLGW